MTPRDLIADLRSRINPAYAAQRGTESYERRLCAEALEAQADEIARLRMQRDGLLSAARRTLDENGASDLPKERDCCGTFFRTPHLATCAKSRGKTAKTGQHIHTGNDGRGTRDVFLNGRLIDRVMYADTRLGFVRVIDDPIRLDKEKKRLLTRTLRGIVEVRARGSAGGTAPNAIVSGLPRKGETE